MPSIHFKGKALVQNHHLAVPTHELRPVAAKGRSARPSLHDNLIVHGDNLKALKSLLPYYHGKVKCVYIDPPYNTGNEAWVYNDNVNSPMINDWIGKVVDREDLTRHDKWLCMMLPRLRLLREFLRDDGVIFISIDDNEVHRLRALLDEVFGEENFVGEIVWRNVTDNNPTLISMEHEYLICYARSKESQPNSWKSENLAMKAFMVSKGQEFIKKYRNNDVRQAEYTKWFAENKTQLWPFDRYKHIDDGGIYTGSQSVHNPGKEGYRYDVIHPLTKKPCQEPLMGYRFPLSTMQELLADNRILYGEDETKIIELKIYAHEYKAKLASLIELDTRVGANELREIFPGQKQVFKYPKPTEYLLEFLPFVVRNEDIVLDAFGGSGSTAQAILSLNKADKGNRRFVLLESEPYADTLTAERVRRVIDGVMTAKDEGLRKGLGGTFSYFELGEAMRLQSLLRGGKLPAYEDLAAYVYFTATGEEFRPGDVRRKKNFIGAGKRYEAYLLYEPEPDRLRDLALTLEFARGLPPPKGDRRILVFAPTKYLDADHLDLYKIDFCQLPYEIYKAAGKKGAT